MLQTWQSPFLQMSFPLCSRAEPSVAVYFCANDLCTFCECAVSHGLGCGFCLQSLQALLSAMVSYRAAL